jgi:hypothetical protein
MFEKHTMIFCANIIGFRGVHQRHSHVCMLSGRSHVGQRTEEIFHLGILALSMPGISFVCKKKRVPDGTKETGGSRSTHV